MSELHLNPTSLSQYIHLDNCERFLRFRLKPEDLKRLEKKWGRTIQPLTPLLKESGTEFEERIAEKLAARGETVVDLSSEEPTKTLYWFQTLKAPTILFQPSLTAPLGNYICSGRADLVRLSRNKQGLLQILIADIKASRQEKTEHRLQVATYAKMIQHLTDSNHIPVAEIKGTVLIQQEDGSYPTLVPNTPTFDLETYFGILDTLVTLPDSIVNTVANQSFESVFYNLNYKCDGCLYNAICLYDSAERLDLSLVPQITAVEKRVLLDSGVQTLRDLASLMELPEDGQYEMRLAPVHKETIDVLKNRWPVAPNLPFLVQRAKSALHKFERGTDYKSFIYNSSFGTLPNDDLYPDLVKVFFDAQRDYLRNRVYLASAYVVGPRGQKAVINLSEEPPTDDIERDLLVDWVRGVIAAVEDVTSSIKAPLHLYCYNRYDQKVLLEALKRHLSAVSTIPAFFDLLTQSPALTQPMISFLSDEVQERYNIGRVCWPLHDVARWLRFDWKDEKYEYYRLFRARVFDNRRDIVRLPNGDIKPADRATPKDLPNRNTIESASRFNSQIPLEYAYSAWECLPDVNKDDSHLLDPFRQVDMDILESFAIMRVKALAHIEASFKYKSRSVEKVPLHIPSLLNADSSTSLARILQEFLYMEHHTSLQNHLLTYSLSLDRRVQSGMAMLLQHERHLQGDLYEFQPEFAALGLDPVLTINSCKLKESDWIVFNPADPPLSPNQIKHGRLAMIEEISQEKVILRLLGVSFRNGDFRYYHKRNLEPEIGQYYMIDQMADDLNADKILEALSHGDNNSFFDWLMEAPSPRKFDQKIVEFFEKFAAYVNEILRNRKLKLTSRQREAVAQHFENPLLLIQGPPGTGKSFTLAWVVLARIASAAVQGRSCRVLLSCKTHNAINVALGALSKAKKQVGVFAPPYLGGQAIFGTEIYKVVNDSSDPVPEGVHALNAYHQKGSLETILSKNNFVIGTTSGGVFNLMKYRALGGRSIDWNEKTFDLVVIDEASQMGIPEGVLASAFLRPDGSMIVVGDHRQMPPIIAHPWKDEQKRSVTDERPYISLFETLIEKGFPCVQLEESFRLHKEIAEFLRENVYSKDGIDFHSKRKELVPQLPHISKYVDVALAPDYPIVVIEHAEQASQQFNEVELQLVKPLIDASVKHLSLDGRTGIGVVVPHRAQKALLRAEFPELAKVNSIDTVERFQGDERDVIIVSATASDPDYVRNEADFLLNLNRLNVAISRPRKKLIVIASRSVVDLLMSDLEVFEQSVIWKRLYHHYTPDILLKDQLNGYKVVIRGRRAT